MMSIEILFVSDNLLCLKFLSFLILENLKYCNFDLVSRDSFFIQLGERQRLYRLSVALVFHHCRPLSRATLVFKDAKCSISYDNINNQSRAFVAIVSSKNHFSLKVRCGLQNFKSDVMRLCHELYFLKIFLFSFLNQQNLHLY